jgi:hypothetical protein
MGGVTCKRRAGKGRERLGICCGGAAFIASIFSSMGQEHNISRFKQRVPV